MLGEAFGNGPEGRGCTCVRAGKLPGNCPGMVPPHARTAPHLALAHPSAAPAPVWFHFGAAWSHCARAAAALLPHVTAAAVA
jgi:hypothetical protein